MRSSGAEELALDPRVVAGLRAARSEFVRAAAGGVEAEIARALDAYVRAMADAQFSELTITSLVRAAVTVGVPPARGPRHRERRAAAIELWAARGVAIAAASRRDR